MEQKLLGYKGTKNKPKKVRKIKPNIKTRIIKKFGDIQTNLFYHTVVGTAKVFSLFSPKK